MHFPRRAVILSAALALMAAVATSGTASAASWTVTALISGLKNPRGIAFDGSGAMYVAEAGLPGADKGLNNSGAVDQYRLVGSAWSRSWSTSFNAAFTHERGAPETIGPSGMSASGGEVLMIMGLNHSEVPVSVGPQIGHLFQLNPADGAASDRGNIGDQQFAWATAHSKLWEEFPDSNPYGVLIARNKQGVSTVYAVDAGANTVSIVRPDGSTKVIAYIPNEDPVAGLPTRDSTPTCAAQGPDGALYIGTLDLVRNLSDPRQGWSHVYRVDLNDDSALLKTATVWASGLTTITSCAFDSKGNFWATEMFKFSSPTAPPGDVVRIAFADPTHPEHIGAGQVPFPGGVVQGPDGAVYVTVNSAVSTTANGMVLRLAQV